MSPLLLIPIIAFVIAQILKNVIFWIHDKKVSTKYLFTDGGMPSAHSAIMAGLVTTLYLMQGASPLFFVTLFVSLIIFRDASGVRFESGKQAVLLNQIAHKLKLKEHLKELIGHTKREVLLGILVGIFTAIIFYPTLV